MAKDPAFLFFSSDFLNGVSDLTMEERGQYITLLCLQHQKGSLSEKTIRLCLGSVSVDVLKKFSKDQSGNFFNERLVKEIEARRKFTESRRNNGKSGGRPKKENNLPESYKEPLGYSKANLMEDENDNEDIIDNEEEKGGTGEKTEVLIWPTFEDFWEEYDYRTGEQAAKYAWQRIPQKEKESIMGIIPNYKLANPDKAYRKKPANYLNEKIYKDEIVLKIDGKQSKQSIIDSNNQVTANFLAGIKNSQLQ